MYCNNCGSPVGTDQVVCPRCGTSIIGARAAVTARTRVAAHVQLISIFWFVIAVMFVIPTFIMLGLSGAATALLRHEEPIARILGPGLFTVLALLFVAHAAASFAAGYGLNKLRPWGRTMAIVVAFWMLFSPPFGTALGIYTLVVLLPAAAGDEYRQMAEGTDGRSSARAA